MADDTRIRLNAHLHSFLLDCEARRLAPGTLAFYREKLTPFVAFLAAQGVGDVAEIAPGHVRAHLVHLQTAGHNAGGQHAAARAIRAWLNFLTAEGDLPDSPMKRVRMPKQDKRILPAFSEEDVGRLLAAARSARDRAIVLCLLDTGLRAAEFVALTVSDVDLSTGAVAVQKGKGGKGRMVYLGAKARRALGRYLRVRGALTGNAPLWVSLTTGEGLTANGLRLYLRRLGKRAGVKHCHPHTFRRTFALWALRAGMNVYALQQIMGHADLTMLRRYLALTESDLAHAHREHGPVDTTLSRHGGGAP